MRDAVALRTLFNAFAQIFLQRHAGCGALVMLALALAAPALLAGALFGVLAAHAGAIWLGCRTADREAGLYGYNAALLGILLVDRLGLSSSSLALVALAALASCVLQARLLGIGQVVFVDDPLAAACLLAAVALARPRDALWLLAGSALGLLLGVWLGAAWASGLAGFNPALAALALAQWRGGWGVPLLGMAVATAIRLLCDSLGLPTLSLPFILATWLGLLLHMPQPGRAGR